MLKLPWTLGILFWIELKVLTAALATISLANSLSFLVFQILVWWIFLRYWKQKRMTSVDRLERSELDKFRLDV